MSYTSFAIKVAKLFNDYKSNAVIEMPEEIKLMIVQKADIYATLLNEIFNMARKTIKERFNIAICKRYKHYWVLKIYFHLCTITFGNIDFAPSASPLTPSIDMKKISSTDTLFDRFFLSFAVKSYIRELFLVFIVFLSPNIRQGFNSLVFFRECLHKIFYTIEIEVNDYE